MDNLDKFWHLGFSLICKMFCKMLQNLWLPVLNLLQRRNQVDSPSSNLYNGCNVSLLKTTYIITKNLSCLTAKKFH